MALVKSPCLKCERRRVLCWNECDDYKAYKKKLEEISDKLAKESFLEEYDHIVHARIKARQRRK